MSQLHSRQGSYPRSRVHIRLAEGHTMPFTLETWKAQVYERLWDWRLRLEQARPASVYSTLSAMALWPLVQAAQSEGMLPMAMALGNVAAGVGGNLIAEQVQRWRDHAAET